MHDIITSQMIGQVDFILFSPCIVLNYAKCDVDTWHYRLGYPAHKVIEYIYKTFPYIQSKGSDVCDVCHLSKQHNMPFTKRDIVSNCCFDLVHLDIWGPIAIPSIHDHKYFLTVVDDHSRHTWISLMHSKSKTKNLFKNS